jgi:vacuolar protein sorting-associated protein 13A/C
MLGDPVNFVSHLGVGVKEFFYKPYDGFIRGPLEGGKGLINGTVGIIKHPIEGTFGSVAKICSSWSKGLLFFIDDNEFINKREEEFKEKARNPIEGLGFGLNQTITGIS